ncbi:MmcB family DNA repair protein [bacterium]|nr:MmcB family DNA repair protein [bacterium]
MTAPEIEKLILDKHWKDFCVTQCKTGGTWGSAWDQTYLEWLMSPGNPVLSRLVSGSRWEGVYERGHADKWMLRDLLKQSAAIMDVWVLRRSWTDGRAICYEIKVSRSDFFGDHKWPDYWHYCNQFFFAVPNGLLSDDEINRLPAQSGVIEVNGTGSGLRIRKTPCSMQGIDEGVFRYILMWRAQLKDGRKKVVNA